MKKRNFLIAIALLVLIFSGSAWAKMIKSPSQVVSEFYSWYIANPTKYRTALSEQKYNFDPVLYKYLEPALKRTHKDKMWIDFDPFANAQWDSVGYKITKSKIKDKKALINVDVQLSRGQSKVKVELKRYKNGWKISNFIYPDYPDAKGFDLLTFLKKF